MENPKISHHAFTTHESSQRFLTAWLVAAFSFLSACGKTDKKSEDSPTNIEDKKPDIENPETPNEPIPEKVEPTPVFAFLGGYTSCPKNADGDEDPLAMDLIDMFDAAKSAVSSIEGIKDPAYLISCYGFDPESINYVLSSNPEKVRFSKVANMEADFAKLLKDTPNPIVFAVGHSYGAYTALKMISTSTSETKISGLVTLDAISKVGCTPANALPAILEYGPAPKECLEAPSDITDEEQKKILAKSTTWLNFYQTDSTILHSGEFSSAKNFKMHYEGTKIKPHMDVLFDADIQKSLVDMITANIKAVLNNEP